MRHPNKRLLQVILGMFGIAAALIALLLLTPYAMADKNHRRLEREQRIVEATQSAQGQMAIEKEVRKMSIRHKPRPAKPRKIN